jgi:hypothetical protein
MNNNYFSLEVENHTLSPIIGCLDISSFNQYISAFILYDKELVFYKKNRDEILDTILKTTNLHEYIFNLINGEENIPKYINEIEKIPNELLHNIGKIFDLENFQKYLITDPKEKSNTSENNQEGGNYGIAIGILIVIGTTIYQFMGKRKIVAQRNFTVNEIPLHNHGKCRVLIIKIGQIVQRKIIKITCNENYFQAYINEITMYNLLRVNTTANVADYTHAEHIFANYFGGEYTALITLDSATYRFKLSEIAHDVILQQLWSSEMLAHSPIEFVYISGNYYPEMIDFNLFINNGVALNQISFCVQNILTNIETAFQEIGFVHGDMKLDNILIETTYGYTSAVRSFIFDLDFSIAFRTTQFKSINNAVNRYLHINQNTVRNRLSKDFLHFFDIYLFNVTLQSKLSFANFRTIFNEIGAVCQSTPHIQNSFKYFYLIYYITADLELYHNGFSLDLCTFQNINQYFIDFATKPAFNSLHVITRDTYNSLVPIFDTQFRNAL